MGALGAHDHSVGYWYRVWGLGFQVGKPRIGQTQSVKDVDLNRAP